MAVERERAEKVVKDANSARDEIVAKAVTVATTAKGAIVAMVATAPVSSVRKDERHGNPARHARQGSRARHVTVATVRSSATHKMVEMAVGIVSQEDRPPNRPLRLQQPASRRMQRAPQRRRVVHRIWSHRSSHRVACPLRFRLLPTNRAMAKVVAGAAAAVAGVVIVAKERTLQARVTEYRQTACP